MSLDLTDAGGVGAQFGDVRPNEHRQQGQRSSEPDVRLAARVAAIVISHSRARQSLAPDVHFEDPQWLMLLDLFVSEFRGVQVSVSSACAAAGVPGATALRHMNRLEAKGMLLRSPHPRDKRSTYVQLTARSREQLTRYLLSIAPDWLGDDGAR